MHVVAPQWPGGVIVNTTDDFALCFCTNKWTMEDYMGKNWPVFKLKDELKKRGSVRTGKKEDLVARLRAFDRNNDFKNEPVIILAPQVLVDWPNLGYAQLVLKDKDKIPPISQGFIKAYFTKRMCQDKQKSGDIKALIKGEALFRALKVSACSRVVKESSSYFTAICEASMKKRVTYNCQVKLSPHAEIINTHCECPSGKGPHGTCKHLAAIIFMLMEFKESGTLMIKKSCTDDLQQFHLPSKAHTGSPVLLGPRHEEDYDDDPRPLALRNRTNHQDFVRNITINAMAAGIIPRIGFSYLFERADTKAAVNDHAYLKRPASEYWFDRAIKVQKDEAEAIEKKTHGQSDCSLWHEQRSWRLTASKFGDVCLATERRDIPKLCKDIVNPAPIGHLPAVEHGTMYEPVAREAFTRKTFLEVTDCGLFIDIERPYLAATPDGLVGKDAIIEIKCSFAGKDGKIGKSQNFPYLYKDSHNLKLKPRHKYMYQIQGQMYIANKSLCYFVVHTLTDLHIEKIHFDEDFVQKEMLPKLDQFYTDHLKSYLVDAQFH